MEAALAGRQHVVWTGCGSMRIGPQLIRHFFEQSVAAIKSATDELLNDKKCSSAPILTLSQNEIRTNFIYTV